jgi:hypothetical protein
MNSEARDLTSPNFLFVCGAARSGTTAMATLLNCHPEIALGIERYKNVKPKDLGKHLFAKERFFDFRATDTNVRDPEIYAQLEKKFSQIRLVGDKVPRYYTRYAELFAAFPGCVVIFMLRDIHAVASSWNIRAVRKKNRTHPGDGWSENDDYIKAVEQWNSALRHTMRFKKKFGERLIVVEYEKLFSGDIELFKSIIGQLGLEFSDALAADFRRKTQNWEALSKKERLEYEGQRRYIEGRADMRTYERLKNIGNGNYEPSGGALNWLRSVLHLQN